MYDPYYDSQAQSATGVDYINRADPALMDRMAGILQDRTQRFDVSNQALSAAIAEYGNLPIPEGEDREKIINYISDLDENIRGQVKDKFGGDYGMAFNAISRRIAKERPLMNQIKQSAEQDAKYKEMYNALVRQGKLVKERFTGIDPETGERLYEKVDPFAESMFDVVDGKLQMVNPRDYSSIREQTDYGAWTAKNLSDKLANDIKHRVGMRYGRDGSTIDIKDKGLTDKQIEEMVAKGEILNDETVRRFIEETSWGFEHGEDIDNARNYLKERLKEQVPHQESKNITRPPVDRSSGTDLAPPGSSIGLPSSGNVQASGQTPREVWDKQRDYILSPQGNILTTEEVSNKVLEDTKRDLERRGINASKLNTVWDVAKPAILSTGSGIYNFIKGFYQSQGAVAGSLLNFIGVDNNYDWKKVHETLSAASADFKNAFSDEHVLKSMAEDIKDKTEAVARTKEITNAIKNNYPALADKTDSEIMDIYSADAERYSDILPTTFSIPPAFSKAMSQTAVERISELRFRLPGEPTNSPGDLKSGTAVKELGFDEVAMKAFFKDNPDSFMYDYDEGRHFMMIPKVKGKVYYKGDGSIDWSKTQTKGEESKVYIDNLFTGTQRISDNIKTLSSALYSGSQDAVKDLYMGSSIVGHDQNNTPVVGSYLVSYNPSTYMGGDSSKAFTVDVVDRNGNIIKTYKDYTMREVKTLAMMAMDFERVGLYNTLYRMIKIPETAK
jgi:polyhydroxyalkanoate synthesis regulator phasin